MCQTLRQRWRNASGAAIAKASLAVLVTVLIFALLLVVLLDVFKSFVPV